MVKNRVLVLCVDRDDDLGVKANVKGPIIGRDAVLDAAEKLGLADPSDSDVNAIFRAVQLYDELRNKGEKVEVAVITGSEKLGIESDRRINEQLENVLKKFDADEVIFVSDGASDEQVLPLINRKVPAVYLDRVIVNQAAKLESTYFVIYNFVRHMINDARYSRMFLGMPAVALIFYAIFGSAAIRLIIGFLGIYLFLKGFQLEENVAHVINAIMDSARKMRISLFLYLTSVTFFIVGIVTGVSGVENANPVGILQSILTFLNASIYTFGISAMAWCVGAYIDKKIRKITALLGVEIMIIALTFLTDTLAELMLTNQLTLTNIGKAIVIVGLMLTLAVIVNSFGKKKRRGLNVLQ